MSGIFLGGALIGLLLLIYAWSRERALDVDAFTALDKLHVGGPLVMPPSFIAAGAIAAASALLGLPAFSPLGAATVAAAMFISVWVVWLAVWVDLRWMLDAAIVFQDHVPLRNRPPAAFSHAPQAALSFRPFSAALMLFAALTVTGLGFGLLAGQFGWTRLLPLLAGGVWLAIGVVFTGYVRAAVRAERGVRRVLGALSEAAEDELFDALRRNPRSIRLLVEHARRLEGAGEHLQALLEYRAAALAGGGGDQVADGIARTRRRMTRRLGPIEGSVVRRRGAQEPRMEVAHLTPSPDAVPVRVLHPARFLGELLAMDDDGLILNVQGVIEDVLAEELRPFEHLAPLVPDDPARPQLPARAWRLTPEVRAALAAAIAPGGGDGVVPGSWVNVRLHTLDRMLVESRSHFALVLAAPDLVQREFIGWRRAAAVAPMAEALEGAAREATPV